VILHSKVDELIILLGTDRQQVRKITSVIVKPTESKHDTQ